MMSGIQSVMSSHLVRGMGNEGAVGGVVHVGVGLGRTRWSAFYDETILDRIT